MQLNGQVSQTSDFVQITDEAVIAMQAAATAKVFIIASPIAPGYPTYAQRMRLHTT